MLSNNSLALDSYFGSEPAIRMVLHRLLHLLCIDELLEHARDWAGVLSDAAFDACEEQVLVLLKQIRPDAVALVDAFGWSDEQLSSTLGRYDGNVYEAIYAAAKANPLNRCEKMIGWDDLSAQLDLEFLEQEAMRQRALPNSKL